MSRRPELKKLAKLFDELFGDPMQLARWLLKEPYADRTRRIRNRLPLRGDPEEVYHDAAFLLPGQLFPDELAIKLVLYFPEHREKILEILGIVRVSDTDLKALQAKYKITDSEQPTSPRSTEDPVTPESLIETTEALKDAKRAQLAKLLADGDISLDTFQRRMREIGLPEIQNGIPVSWKFSDEAEPQPLIDGSRLTPEHLQVSTKSGDKLPIKLDDESIAQLNNQSLTRWPELVKEIVLSQLVIAVNQE